MLFRKKRIRRAGLRNHLPVTRIGDNLPLGFESLEARTLLDGSGAAGDPPIVVTTLDDTVATDGLVSLREAIEAANTDTAVNEAPAGNGADTIVFDESLFDLGSGTLTLGGFELVISGNLTLTGPGADLLTIDANQLSRVFRMARGSTVAMSGITVTGGRIDGDGAGIQSLGSLTLESCSIVDNQHGSSSGVHYGGGIYSDGYLSVTDCTIADNHGDEGGGIHAHRGTTIVQDSVISRNSGNHGGGIHVRYNGSLEVINSEISDNTRGGGIGNWFTSGGRGGRTTVVDSVVSGNASSQNGGGIFSQGTLEVRNSVITGNSVTSANRGGGIHGQVESTTIIDSTISNNHSAAGGAIYKEADSSTLRVINSTLVGNESRGNGGAIFSENNVTISNSTISDNSAVLDGGGLHLPDGASNWTVENSTIANNTAVNGGGIKLVSGTLNVDNTIIANNSATTLGNDISAILNGDFNLIEDSLGGFVFGSNNITGVDPSLGTLADNGGPTFTHALSAGSAAIDAGTANGLNFDQRGEARTFDDPGTTNAAGSDGTDIGAFEVTALDLALIVNSALDNQTPGDGLVTLREAVHAANTGGTTDLGDTGSGADLIIFADELAGEVITLSGGQLQITDDLTITGLGADVQEVNGNDANRIFEIVSGITANISGLTIADGREDASHGAGILNAGDLTLTDSVVHSNSTATGVGGGIRNTGTLVVERSTLSENFAIQGAGISNDNTLEVRESSFVDNRGGTQGAGIRTSFAAYVYGSTFTGGSVWNEGGAIANYAGVAVVVNSTISGNSSVQEAGGLFNGSGGRLEIFNSTITGNRSDTNDSGSYFGTGGGLRKRSGQLIIRNSIIAGNFRGTGTTADDVSAPIDYETNNVIGGDPSTILNPNLADNGGPTLTHMLVSGSPAINNGVDLSNGIEVENDQRGVPRPQGSAYDIGAVEIVGEAPVAVDDEYELNGNSSLVVDQVQAEVSSVIVVEQSATDLVYDSVTDTIYASVGSNAGGSGSGGAGAGASDSVTAINPENGEIGSSVSIGTGPSEIVLADDGEKQSIYAVVEDRRAIQAVDVASGVLGEKFYLPGSGQYATRVKTIHAIPGRDAVLISRYYAGFSPPAGGTAVYVDGVALPDHVGSGLGTGGPDVTTVDETGEHAYGYQNSITSFDFWEMGIDENGVHSEDLHRWGSMLSGFNVGRIAVAKGRLFTSRGEIIELETRLNVGSFVGAGNFLLDSQGDKFFSVTSSGTTHTIHVYSMTTLELVESLDVTGASGGTGSLTRFGADGLAMRNGDQILLVRSEAFKAYPNYGLLINDHDPDGDEIHARVVGEPENGSVEINPDGTFEYTPQPGFSGVDRFTYVANDGVRDSNVATVTINVGEVNLPPEVDLNGPESDGLDTVAMFTEYDGPTSIFSSNLSVIDPDDEQLVSATVTITNLLDGDAEVLGVNSGDTPIDVSFAGGVLTLAGPATAGEFQEVLRTLTYNNTADDPDTTVRTVEVVVNDTTDTSPTATSLVTVKRLPSKINPEEEDSPPLPDKGDPPSNWEDQRSEIRTFVVNFTVNVVITAADLKLTHLGKDAPIDDDTTMPLTDDDITVIGTQLIVRLSSYELPDGYFELVVLPTATDVDGNSLVNEVLTHVFHKLTSDFNGDGLVDIIDVSVFVYWFFEQTTVAPDYVDLDGSGFIDIADVTIMISVFFTFVVPPAEGGGSGSLASEFAAASFLMMAPPIDEEFTSLTSPWPGAHLPLSETVPAAADTFFSRAAVDAALGTYRLESHEQEMTVNRLAPLRATHGAMFDRDVSRPQRFAADLSAPAPDLAPAPYGANVRRAPHVFGLSELPLGSGRLDRRAWELALAELFPVDLKLEQ